MKNVINRRDFLKYSIGGLATVFVGTRLLDLHINEALAVPQAQTLKITITDALKDMVTDNPGNPAKCYFWIYKMDAVAADGTVTPISAEVPGPNIFAIKGDTISGTITNELDEDHAFAIPGIFDSGIIPAGAKDVPFTFTATTLGAHLYHDNLNQPVNRVMGLHGAFVVMPDPAVPVPGHKFTPYDNPTPGVQKLFDDFGTSAHYPGYAWEDGETNPPAPGTQFADTPAFRTYIWLFHQASPKLFAEVGNWPSGQDYPAQQFLEKFLRDPFNPLHDPFDINAGNNIPIYFTINGQSGHFSHNNPLLCPNLRAGEPCVLHILNAGLWTHSMHLHANHFYITFDSKLGGVQENPIWVDVYNVEPMDRIDYTLPYMRPPDVPNRRGIGNPDILGRIDPLKKDEPLTSLNGHPVWPPTEEMALSFGKVIPVQLSPLCYPAHDHAEQSQTSQGGNYNLGLISGMNFTGDRNTPGGVTTFPNPPNKFPENRTGLAAPPE